jgi:DnaJ-class molecular chaperone
MTGGDGPLPAGYYDTHCSRCGDEYDSPGRDHRLCEDCEKQIQRSKLIDGVRCRTCNGHGYVFDTYCDIQRATNGRDKRCPDCLGSGRVTWTPDVDDVHPDLRTEVTARVE